MGELVDDVEHAELPSVMSALLEEVVGPDVVGALGPQPDADPSLSTGVRASAAGRGPSTPRAARLASRIADQHVDDGAAALALHHSAIRAVEGWYSD